MISQNIKEKFRKQHYGMVGNHSMVKICGWTKSMIKNEGGCYKLKFYGIMSHQCMQMTTSLSCANRCIFCWRDYKEPVSKKWDGCVDEPEFILNEISDHLEELEGKTFLLEDELKRILDEVILKANIGIISTDELKEHVLRAKEISPDVDDIPYLALALKLGCAIWSNDRELKEKQSIVIVYNSQEVLNMV